MGIYAPIDGRLTEVGRHFVIVVAVVVVVVVTVTVFTAVPVLIVVESNAILFSGSLLV